MFLFRVVSNFRKPKEKIRPEFTLLIGTGFVGSFTTFSTFSVETLTLLQQGLMFQGILYVLTTTILGLGLTYLGRKLALLKKEHVMYDDMDDWYRRFFGCRSSILY